MSSGNGKDRHGDDHAVVLNAFSRQLEETGFFDQIRTLESSLRKIAEDLGTLGRSAIVRHEETENLAAHLLAVEALLVLLLDRIPVDDADVRAVIRATTGDPATSPDGSPGVQDIADGILARARDRAGRD